MIRIFRHAVVSACLGFTIFLAAHASTYFLPQVAIGTAGTLQVQTLVTISNPSTSTTNATVVLATIDDDGQDWAVTWEARGRPDLSSTSTWFELALLPGQTVTMLAKSSGPITTGWMRGVSSVPVVLTVRYGVATVVGAGADPQWEVGVLPTAASNEHFAFVGEAGSDWSASTTSTALAIGNTSFDACTITLELFGIDGGAPIKTKTVNLPGNGHIAKFVAEIFDDVSFAPAFRGMLRISANTAVAVLTLQKWDTGLDSVYSSAATVPFHASKTNLCFEDEPSDSPGTGPVISLPGEAVGILSSSSDGADTDYFRVYLTTGQTVAVIALGQMLGSTLVPEIAFLSPDHSVLATGSSFLSGFGESALQVTVQQTGFYGLRIRSPSSSHGRQHFYRLFLGQK